MGNGPLDFTGPSSRGPGASDPNTQRVILSTDSPAGTTTVAATYNTTPPTLTNGQSSPLQADANGNLKISGTISATSAATSHASLQSFSDGTSNPVQADASGATKVGGQAPANATAGGNPVRIGGIDSTGKIQDQAMVQIHNADNQSSSSNGFSSLQAGVAQLQNVAGNTDRQRETGLDAVPALGIASGASQFAMVFSTSSTGNLASGTQTYTPAAMSGLIQGVPWSIQVGTVLTVDTGTPKENVVVTAVTSTTFTALFANAHNGSTTAFPISGFVYNQERDASGELDGATGSGTNVAVGYLYNGGSVASGNYDRERSLQAKLSTTSTISSGGGSASTSLTVSAAPTGLQPRQQVLLYKAANFPAAGYYEVAYIGFNYTVGSTTVPLASAIVNAVTYDTLMYEVNDGLGPKLNGFTCLGIPIAEEAVFDPVTGKYFIERSATADAMATQNIVAEAPALYNGTTMDRARGGITGAQSSATGFENALVMPQYNSTAPSLTNGQFVNAQCDTSGNLKVTVVSQQAGQGTTTDGSGSITTGGTSQQIFAANAARRYLFVQNTSTSNLYINFTSAASASTIVILTNGSFVMESSYITTEAITVFGATTGQTFVAKQG